MKYVMELNEKQYNHIVNCVEAVHRISCGQLSSLNEIVPNRIEDELLSLAKQQAFPELGHGEEYKWDGGYRGTIHSEEFRKAFDLFQAQGYQIYRHMCYVRNVAKGIDNILSSPALTTEKAEQPKIKVIEE